MMSREISIRKLLNGSEHKLALGPITVTNGLSNRLYLSEVQNFCEAQTGRSLLRRVVLMVSPGLKADPLHREWNPRPAFLDRVRDAEIPCIFIAASERIGDRLCRFAESNGIPILASAHDSVILESRLQGLLREKIDRRLVVHGVLLNVCGLGVLIQGESGAGKTRIGIMLAQRGHQWIADDAVEIEHRRRNRLYARGCRAIRGLVDLKEYGIQKAEDLCNNSRPEDGTNLHLVLKIEGPEEDCRAKKHRDIQEILGVKIPCLRIPFFRDPDFDVRKVEKSIEAIIRKREVI
jgi:HPr kinase/phosphorylase